VTPGGPEAVRRRVLVAGGGPAALELVLALRAIAPQGADVTLLAPGRHFTHRTLADGESRTVRLPLAALAQRLRLTHVRDALDRVDDAARVVHTQDGVRLPYDTAVLAVGARLIGAVPGALTYRGARDLARLHAAVDGLEGSRSAIVFAVPGGAADTRVLWGLVLHVADRVARRRIDAELTVVTPEAEPLRGEDPAAVAALAADLQRLGIRVHAGVLPGRHADGQLFTEQLGALPADLVVALPHVSGPAIQGVPSDAAGFALVDDDGRLEGLEHAYAIGAMATRVAGPGGVAQQADALARLLARVPDVRNSHNGGGHDGFRRLSSYVAEHGEVVPALA
jgi:sulfide:quinone oxidoreductase